MNKTFDRYVSTAFLLLGIVIIILSQDISGSSYGSNVGSSVFPVCLGSLMILLGLYNFYETFKAKSKEKSAEKLDYKKFIIILAASVAYVMLLEILGYIISTFLFLLAGFYTMDKKGLWKSILIAAVISAGVYYLYVVVMNGTLPGFPAWLSR